VRALWWLLAVLYAGGIYWFSAQPGGLVGLPPPWDKVVHFVEYAVLAYLLGKATGRRDAAWVLAAWYGALDEVHQAFAPEREAGIGDWWADLAGAFVGAWIATRRAPRRRGEAHPSVST